MHSLTENVSERDWSFAIISETWFVEGYIFDQSILELKQGHGIESICLNRKDTVGRTINYYDLSSALDDFLNIKCIDSPPTRGTERLDLLLTNRPEEVVQCRLCPPLESMAGQRSDHSILECTFKIGHRHSFHWVKYRTRDLTKKNHEKFHAKFTAVDWKAVIGEDVCPSSMTRSLQQTVTELTDECFSWRERKVRSTNDPWITDEICRVIRRMKRKCGKEDRSVAWQAIKDESDHLIKESKSEYYKKAITKLQENGSAQLPYRILKGLSIPDRPNPWTINSTRPSLKDAELAEELASYFVKIHLQRKTNHL